MNKVAKCFSGWNSGYAHLIRTDQIKKHLTGHNYYGAVFYHSYQVSAVAKVILRISGLFPQHHFQPLTQTLCRVIPWLIIPINLYAASIASSNYQCEAPVDQTILNRFKFKIAQGHNISLKFIAKHLGEVTYIAMVTGSVALIILGDPLYGVPLLAALTYQIIDRKIYREISLSIERWMPFVCEIETLINGSMLDRTIVIFDALEYCSNYLSISLSIFLIEKTDQLFHLIFNLETPTLAEINAPLVVNKELTFDEIRAIIYDTDSKFEFNPAHYSKEVFDSSKLPTESDMTKFKELFTIINEKLSYPIINNKVKDDDHFIAFLNKEFDTVDKATIKKSCEDYITELAKRQNISEEVLVRNWLTEQQIGFVEILTGKRRVDGEQEILDRAISLYKKVLPYLQSLKDQESWTELGDCLLKLSVEAGTYCADAHEREAKHLVKYAVQAANKTIHTPVEDYEFTLREALQNKRLRIVEGFYAKGMENLKLNAIKNDTHTFEALRLTSTWGFCPLPVELEASIDITDIIPWLTLGPKRALLYNNYQKHLDQIFKEIGNLRFGVYLSTIINNNPHLNEVQKENILDIFTENNNQRWQMQTTNHRFHRLVLVMLGVMRKKPNLDLG